MKIYYGLKDENGVEYKLEINEGLMEGLYIRNISPIKTKKQLPVLKTREDFAIFLTEYYRIGNMRNFLNQYFEENEK